METTKGGRRKSVQDSYMEMQELSDDGDVYPDEPVALFDERALVDPCSDDFRSVHQGRSSSFLHLKKMFLHQLKRVFLTINLNWNVIR